MVRRAGRDVIPVEIYKSTYDLLKKIAALRGMNAKAFVNFALEVYVERERVLKERFPGLSIEAGFGNRLVIKDIANREFVDVYLKDYDAYCWKDKTNHCKHTKFLWLLPEIASLLKRVEIWEQTEKATQGGGMVTIGEEDDKMKQAFEEDLDRRVQDTIMKQTMAKEIKENDQALKRPQRVPKHVKEP
jgi:hypothetical protein